MTKASRKSAVRTFQKDPKVFFKNVLGVETLEDYQAMVIDTVAANSRTAISACHDVGKSFLMARIAMWFLNSYTNSKVITTAPTYNQVERILWSEIRAAHGKAKWPLGGKLNQTDWTFSPDWFALGFSPRNEVSSDGGQGTQSSFQGFHAAHLLVIFDEATGIAPNIWTMAEGLLTSAHVKFVAIGNPTSANSEFYRCFKDPAWAKVYLSCFNSPNLIANGINNVEDLTKEVSKVKTMKDEDFRAYVDSYKVTKPYLLTTKWVVEQAKKWGLDHPLTISKILGKFPEASNDTLIPLGLVESAQLRKVSPLTSDRKIIGADIARFGSNASILTGLHGRKQVGLKKFYKSRTTEVTGEIIQMAREMEFDKSTSNVIVVDETGIGGGVVDMLVQAKNAPETKELLRYTEIRGVQFGEACEADKDKEMYTNMKARMFGLLADDMAKDGDEGLELFNEAAYLEELPSIKKKYNSKGQLVIESKDDYKKRTGRDSPDHADSLALGNFGRYDNLKIGTFNESFNKNTPPPMAGGFKNVRNW